MVQGPYNNGKDEAGYESSLVEPNFRSNAEVRAKNAKLFGRTTANGNDGYQGRKKKNVAHSSLHCSCGDDDRGLVCVRRKTNISGKKKKWGNGFGTAEVIAANVCCFWLNCFHILMQRR